MNAALRLEAQAQGWRDPPNCSHLSYMDTMLQDPGLQCGCEHAARMAIVGTGKDDFPVKAMLVMRPKMLATPETVHHQAARLQHQRDCDATWRPSFVVLFPCLCHCPIVSAVACAFAGDAWVRA